MSNARSIGKLAPLAAYVSSLISLAIAGGQQASSGLPTGTVLDFAGTEANVPTGFLPCDGRAISRTAYATLFTAIGTTHGAGDGTTTFNLPDTRGRVVAGVDNMGGTAANRLTTAGSGLNGAALGSTGGGETHTLTTAQMPAHNHTASTDTAAAHTHTATYQASALSENQSYAGISFGKYTGGDPMNYMQITETPTNAATSSAGSHSHVVTVNNNGSGSAHPNVQPTITFNKIIKT